MLLQWLGGRKERNRATIRERLRFRPRVEALEDRCLLSVTANPDAYSVVHDQVLSVQDPGVLSNDTDDSTAPLTAVLLSGPAHGDLSLYADGSFVYTPAAHYVGADSFTYYATDGLTNSNAATVSLTMTDSPIAHGKAVATRENVAVSGNLTVSTNEFPGSVIDNFGTWEAQDDADILLGGGNGNTEFINDVDPNHKLTGTFSKTESNGGATDIDIAFVNWGVVNRNGLTINFNGGYGGDGRINP